MRNASIRMLRIIIVCVLISIITSGSSGMHIYNAANFALRRLILRRSTRRGAFTPGLIHGGNEGQWQHNQTLVDQSRLFSANATMPSQSGLFYAQQQYLTCCLGSLSHLQPCLARSLRFVLHLQPCLVRYLGSLSHLEPCLARCFSTGSDMPNAPRALARYGIKLPGKTHHVSAPTGPTNYHRGH